MKGVVRSREDVRFYGVISQHTKNKPYISRLIRDLVIEVDWHDFGLDAEPVPSRRELGAALGVGAGVEAAHNADGKVVGEKITVACTILGGKHGRSGS
jgi:hypothetical protein